MALVSDMNRRDQTFKKKLRLKTGNQVKSCAKNKKIRNPSIRTDKFKGREIRKKKSLMKVKGVILIPK